MENLSLEELFKKVEELVTNNKHYDAVSLLKEKLETDCSIAEKIETAELIGEVYILMGKPEKALKSLEQIKEVLTSEEEKGLYEEKYNYLKEKVEQLKKEEQEQMAAREEKNEDEEESLAEIYAKNISPLEKLISSYRKSLLPPYLIHLFALFPGSGHILLKSFGWGFFYSFSFLLIAVITIFDKINAWFAKVVYIKYDYYIYDLLDIESEEEFIKYFRIFLWVILIIYYLKIYFSFRKLYLFRYFPAVIRQILEKNQVVLTIGEKEGVSKGNYFKVYRIAAGKMAGLEKVYPFGMVKHIGYAKILDVDKNISFAQYEFKENEMISPEKNDVALRIA